MRIFHEPRPSTGFASAALGAAAMAALIHLSADHNRDTLAHATPGSSEAQSAEEYAEGFDITSGVFAGIALSSAVGSVIARRLGE